jgi:hypothetical protein
MDSENRMPVRSSLISLALAVALFAAGCSDTVGSHPTAVGQALAVAPHILQWPGTPQFSAVGAPAGRGSGAILRPTGLSLAQYSGTFWAVRGVQRSVQINYLSAAGDTSFPFLRLAITDPVYVPGRGELAPGDSVLITVGVDTTQIKVSLEPTGLVFGEPAQLQISYGGAAGDLNGDGVVDSADSYIESQLLGLWYREGSDSAWTPIPAVQSLSEKSFTSGLLHFCEYAVSW